MITLQTARLALTPCRPSDRPDFVDLELDPDVMRFLNGGAVDQRTHPEDVSFLMPRGTEPHVWTARNLVSGSFVGWFCLFPKTEKLAEIGYRLGRMNWGQGFASEGASTLLSWGFENGGYERITASTMAVNRRSRRVMEKIGMKHTFTDFTAYPNPIPGSEHGEVWHEVSRQA